MSNRNLTEAEKLRFQMDYPHIAAKPELAVKASDGFEYYGKQDGESARIFYEGETRIPVPTTSNEHMDLMARMQAMHEKMSGEHDE